jgi:hypothetical protein
MIKFSDGTNRGHVLIRLAPAYTRASACSAKRTRIGKQFGRWVNALSSGRRPNNRLQLMVITDLLPVLSRGSIESPPGRDVKILGLRVVAESPEDCGMISR